MQPDRIAELLVPFLGPADGRRLTAHDLNRISTYIDILLRWNARINLTAIRNEEEIVTRHFGESFFAARHLFPPETAALEDGAISREKTAALAEKTSNQRPTTHGRFSVADVGSGAGFPGIPLKLWAPQISLTLIESNHKKATFLREVARALILTDINIQTARAQDIIKSGSRFDVVTLRAVERFPEILPAAAALAKPKGRLALLIGSAQQDQLHQTLPTFRWHSAIPLPISRARVLLTGTREPEK